MKTHPYIIFYVFRSFLLHKLANGLPHLTLLAGFISEHLEDETYRLFKSNPVLCELFPVNAKGMVDLEKARENAVALFRKHQKEGSIELCEASFSLIDVERVFNDIETVTKQQVKKEYYQ